ncbi:hypothetical protein K523DRAFT_415255 [Schizophyllum commune Tattone D]|nr:hypothetical protein K523DRAFT_415255 [Schizophyllum commune Tattone D]
MSSSTQETPSGEDLPRLIVSWSEFVALVADRTSTPYFMQQQFLDETMTSSLRRPWLPTHLASPESFIEAGAISNPYSEVIAGVDLNNVYICNPWPEREPPALLALYPLPLLDSSPANASEARLEGFKTAAQQISDAGRNLDCRLIHLCPVCGEKLSKKSLLREHLRSHA